MQQQTRRNSILWISIVIVMLAVLNLLAWLMPCRWDMTVDKRYSLSAPTIELLHELEGEVEVTCYLDGSISSDYQQLLKATKEMVEDLDKSGAEMRWCVYDAEADRYQEVENAGLQAERIIVKSADGRSSETTIYPYVQLRYQQQNTWINLRKGYVGRQDKESFDACIQRLEKEFAAALFYLRYAQSNRLLVVTGHHELTAGQLADFEALAQAAHYQVDRGYIGNDPKRLSAYQAIVIAGPQTPFSEVEKYVLDQYVQQGGSVLWALDGIAIRPDMLSQVGYTPAIALDVNLSDMLFCYGIRVNPGIIQDKQCLSIPVDISEDPNTPNYQQIPWYYSPLLLTSQQSSVTEGVGYIRCNYPSPLDLVGGNDGLEKDILLASSTASRVVRTPANVEPELYIEDEAFQYAYIPVAASIMGKVRSVFEHRMVPEGVVAGYQPVQESKASKHIVIATSSIIANESQNGMALPMGYDRYSGEQFGNRELITNAIHYLCMSDKEMKILAEKSFEIRRLNEEKAYKEKKPIQHISTITPILILLLIGLSVLGIRKRKYSRR